MCNICYEVLKNHIQLTTAPLMAARMFANNQIMLRSAAATAIELWLLITKLANHLTAQGYDLEIKNGDCIMQYN